ncbi:MAG: thioredoxin [Bacillota bacterium]
MILEVNERNFEKEVLQSSVPVMVDFWAAWCGPCRSMSPVVEQVADEFAGRVKVAKLNVDENQSLTQRYGIKGIPTLLFFQNGKVVAQEVGYTPKDSVTQKLNRILGID